MPPRCNTTDSMPQITNSSFKYSSSSPSTCRSFLRLFVLHDSIPLVSQYRICFELTVQNRFVVKLKPIIFSLQRENSSANSRSSSNNSCFAAQIANEKRKGRNKTYDTQILQQPLSLVGRKNCNDDNPLASCIASEPPNLWNIRLRFEGTAFKAVTKLDQLHGYAHSHRAHQSTEDLAQVRRCGALLGGFKACTGENHIAMPSLS